MIQPKSLLKSSAIFWRSPSFWWGFKRIIGILILAIAYYATAELSRQLASTPQGVTPVWPSDGIAVGAVWLFGNWMGFGVFLGSFLANFWAFQDRSTWTSLAISTLPVLGIAIGTTCGTILGTFLLRKTTDLRYPLERVSNVFKFLIFTSMLGSSINATVGVISLAFSGKVDWAVYGNVWLTWWISNVSGIFIIAPVLLSWAQLIQQQNFSLKHFLSVKKQSSLTATIPQINHLFSQSNRFKLWLTTELLLLLGLVIVISDIIFLEDYDVEYMLIPILIWSAFRLGAPGATLLTFIVAAIAVIATVNNKGGFVGATLNQSLMQLQSFIGVITLTILILIATIAERTQAEKKLRLAFQELAKTNENLESRVQERTAELNEKNIILEETLATLKQTQLQMLHSEKMSALGQMVAGIAHEINNPISFIHGNIKPITEYIQDLFKALQIYQAEGMTLPPASQAELEELDIEFIREDLPKILQSMKVGTERIRTIVLSLRNFSRLGEAELKTVDIHEGIDSTLVILQHRLKATTSQPEIQIVKQYGQLPLIKCDASAMNQVFMNLLSNAIDALTTDDLNESMNEANLQPKTIVIQTEQTDENKIRMTFTDNGIGIRNEILSKIFDPFFTTKAIGKGTGLGLSISYQIVTEKHGGDLWCESNLGQGTKFVIELFINV